MELKIAQQVGQKQHLGLTQELALGLNVLHRSTSKLEEFLYEEAEKNPYITLTPPKERGLYFPFGKSNLEYNDEILTQKIGEEENLLEEIREEIRFMRFSASEKWIAEVIVSSLKINGELLVSLLDIANYTKKTIDEVKGVFKALQKKYPIIRLPKTDFVDNYIKILFEGNEKAQVLAKAILKIILKESTKLENAEVLQEELDKKIEEQIKKKYQNMSLEEIRQFKKELFQKMKPLFYMVVSLEKSNTTPLEVLRPDIVIEIDYDNFLIKSKLYDEYLPEITINKNIKAETLQKKELVKNAKQLIDAVKRRRVSLGDFIEKLIIKQSRYFFEGESALLPFTRNQMAKEIGVHASTITRMTQNKHFYLEGRILPLKIFFTKKVKGIIKEFGRNEVLQTIKKIMALEKEYGKVTDKKVMEVLANKGIILARRTVNKYRNLIKQEKS